ncbi:MAG: C39 family peptidase, partial [Nocardioidaceae bacterium]
NTAYAARFGLTAYVTRMRSMAEAEQFIAAGIPLVVSVTFTEEQLDGAGYGTAGHLLTIIGFDADGNVVSNDPASHQLASNEEVRATYDRRQFEDAWLARTGGIAYVIHPPDVTPPPPPPEPTW